jgi:hypothetical protein
LGSGPTTHKTMANQIPEIRGEISRRLPAGKSKAHAT